MMNAYLTGSQARGAGVGEYISPEGLAGLGQISVKQMIALSLVYIAGTSFVNYKLVKGVTKKTLPKVLSVIGGFTMTGFLYGYKNYGGVSGAIIGTYIGRVADNFVGRTMGLGFKTLKDNKDWG